MTAYREMYFALFNSVTDAIEKLQHGESAAATALLIAAQQKTEEMYMEEEQYG